MRYFLLCFLLMNVVFADADREMEKRKEYLAGQVRGIVGKLKVGKEFLCNFRRRHSVKPKNEIRLHPAGSNTDNVNGWVYKARVKIRQKRYQTKKGTVQDTQTLSGTLYWKVTVRVASKDPKKKSKKKVVVRKRKVYIKISVTCTNRNKIIYKIKKYRGPKKYKHLVEFIAWKFYGIQ